MGKAYIAGKISGNENYKLEFNTAQHDLWTTSCGSHFEMGYATGIKKEVRFIGEIPELLGAKKR